MSRLPWPTGRRNRWILGIAIGVAATVSVLFAVAGIVAWRLDPYLRERAVSYLEQRFDSEAEVGALRVRVPLLAPLRLLFFGGRGALATVSGEDIVLRHRGRRDIPPLFVLGSFTASVDLGSVFDDPKTVRQVTLDGMEINIPPKGQREGITGTPQKASDPKNEGGEKSSVIVEEVLVRDASLRILPKENGKVPLKFDLHDIRLESAGKDVAMKYEALLTNAKPPGEISSSGTFGPWASGEPGDTPLGGEYLFENADLGVFTGIAGVLRSTGNFTGTLSSITARGEATVPDFRLKQAGNPVPLETRFEVLVDGTNGNTELQPVIAKLGSTRFTTTGFIVKHDGEPRKTIELEASMPDGQLRDALLLAMRGSPIMEGKLKLQTKIGIPPLDEKVKEKLTLDGEFEVNEGRFLDLNVQDKVDALSRRGQGQPKNQGIEDTFHQMTGRFTMSQGTLTFDSLAFAIPGAAINIGGDFDMGSQQLDFHGALMLDAHVSETVSGWKRWVLKPLDPFFSKRGAGTFLHIKVEGTAKDPKFGLDPGGTSPMEEAEKRSSPGQAN